MGDRPVSRKKILDISSLANELRERGRADVVRSNVDIDAFLAQQEGALRAIARGFLREDEIEDAIAIANAKFFRADGLNVAKPVPFLRKILKTTCCDLLAQRNRHEQLNEARLGVESTHHGDTNELHRLVRVALRNLKEAYRDALIRVHVHGQSRKAAADELGISESTFRGRLATATHALREEVVKQAERANIQPSVAPGFLTRKPSFHTNGETFR